MILFGFKESFPPFWNFSQCVKQLGYINFLVFINLNHKLHGSKYWTEKGGITNMLTSALSGKY